jgi:hypothetical protein
MESKGHFCYGCNELMMLEKQKVMDYLKNRTTI